jgi:hypothetical protein
VAGIEFRSGVPVLHTSEMNFAGVPAGTVVYRILQDIPKSSKSPQDMSYILPYTGV